MKVFGLKQNIAKFKKEPGFGRRVRYLGEGVATGNELGHFILVSSLLLAGVGILGGDFYGKKRTSCLLTNVSFLERIGEGEKLIMVIHTHYTVSALFPMKNFPTRNMLTNGVLSFSLWKILGLSSSS